MTNEQLVLEIRAGNNVTENMKQLYERNLGMIRKIARKYHGLEDDEDLMQEAYFGLIRAVELWEPEMEVSFITYANYWFKQAMCRYIQNCSNTIRVSSYQYENISKYKRAVNSIRTRFGRDPHKAEIMYLLEISSDQYENLLKDVRTLWIRSTSEPIGGEYDDLLLEDTIPAEGDQIEEVVEKIYKEELSDAVWSEVDKLPEREALAIRNKYCDGMTLAQCGEALGVSPERVRQLQSNAFRKLRSTKVQRRLIPYLTESTAYSVGIKSSFSSFKSYGESVQERAVMLLEKETGPIWKD